MCVGTSGEGELEASINRCSKWKVGEQCGIPPCETEGSCHCHGQLYSLLGLAHAGTLSNADHAKPRREDQVGERNASV